MIRDKPVIICYENQINRSAKPLSCGMLWAETHFVDDLVDNGIYVTYYEHIFFQP
jgi:hypothetical protein